MLPSAAHGHLHCLGCHESWEISEDEAAALRAVLRQRRGFDMDITHLSVSGHCPDCRAGDRGSGGRREDGGEEHRTAEPESHVDPHFLSSARMRPFGAAA